MTLRQFGSVSELLVKLKADLEAAFPSFFREFLSSKANGENGGGSTNNVSSASEEADDGVTLLLDLLKAIQVKLIITEHYELRLRIMTNLLEAGHWGGLRIYNFGSYSEENKGWLI